MPKLTEGMRRLLWVLNHHRDIEYGPAWCRPAKALQQAGLCKVERVKEAGCKVHYKIELTPEGVVLATALNEDEEAPAAAG
jgi:hypothetical protein